MKSQTYNKPDTCTRVLSITNIRLHAFRNYAQLELNPEGHNVVLTGDNGAGKTNILEALSMLVPGRGLQIGRAS
ncbi:MAG: AAA family ATPase, partial [Alphaproteobacteria bacterium]